MTDSVLQSKTPVVGATDDSEGMSYLESLPRRVVTLYIPLGLILIVLLFPFYWMALTSIKPDEQLIDMNTYNPFWVVHPTFKHISKLLFETQYPRWLWNTMYVAVGATTLSIIASVLAAYAIVRLRFKGADTVGVLSNDWFVNLLEPGTEWHPAGAGAERFAGTTSDGRAWTATRNDLVFAANSELRALAEVYAADDAGLKFATDFAAAFARVLDADRYDLR